MMGGFTEGVADGQEGTLCSKEQRCGCHLRYAPVVMLPPMPRPHNLVPGRQAACVSPARAPLSRRTSVRFESDRFTRACKAPSLAIELRSENQFTKRDPVERRLSPGRLRSSRVKPGDVLVSRPTARADVYHIHVVPAASHASRSCYEDGMEAARQLARSLGADAWFTCDHTHVVSISLRPDAEADALRRLPVSSTRHAQNRQGDREQRHDRPTDEADARRPNDEVPADRREDREPARRDRDDQKQERKDRRGS